MSRPITRRGFARAAAVGLTGASLVVLGHAQDAPQTATDLITNETQAAIDRGLVFLTRSQSGDGSYSDYQGPNAAISGLSGLALMAGGYQPGRGIHGRTITRSMDYLINRANSGRPTGYLIGGDQLGHSGGMYQHGFASLFLSELHGMLPDPAQQRRLRDALEKAIAVIIQSQNSLGGWRYTPYPSEADVSVTVAQLMALRAARNAGIFVPKSTVDAAVNYIKACQQPDGGFCYIKGQDVMGSAFARSAAALVGLYCAGIYEGEPIDKALKYLMQFLPGQRAVGGGGFGMGGGFRGDFRGDRYYFYAHYYAALAMWTAGGNYWAEWFPAIRDELLNRARSAPSQVWTDTAHGSSYGSAMACIILQLPNNYLPILQK